MKILDLHKTITTDFFLTFLQQKLNPLFHQQKQSDINFIVESHDDVVEILEPENYEGFLFRFEIKRTELHITRSEHYLDDVNSLTLESILNTLFEELAKDGKVTLVLEG
jgi:hypothetical protein